MTRTLYVACPQCGRDHPANEDCRYLPVVTQVLAPTAGVTMFATPPNATAWWVERCHRAEAEGERLREETARLACERDQARAGLADAERLTRGLVSRLRDVASRIGPARQADDIRAALEEVLRGADCRDLPRDTAPDEARAGRDVLARELSRAQGDVADLARQRDEARAAAAQALAVLRRWQEWFRWGTAVPPRQTENSGDIARDTDTLLAAAPAPSMPCCRCGGTGRERVYPASESPAAPDAVKPEATLPVTPHRTIREIPVAGAVGKGGKVRWFTANIPPAPGPSRVSDGLPVRCSGCGRETTALYDGRCRYCQEHEKRNGSGIVQDNAAPLVETYPCGCQGTPGYRCPVHSCP